jgi:hypothetical protein
MDKEVFDRYVQERYAAQMDYYRKSSAENQASYKRFQWLLIILSALTPVFAALNNIKSTIFGIDIGSHLGLVVVLVSSIVAILTTSLKTFNYQELWSNYRATYERLKPEIHYYHFNAGPYAVTGTDKESLFVTRIEGILNAEHVHWPPAKTSNESTEKTKQDAKEG